MPLAAFPKCFLDALCVRRDMTVDQWIDLAMRFDVDGLEFYWGFLPLDQPGELERLGKRVEAQGRSIPMLCYSSDFTQPDATARQEEVARQRRAIEACAALGGHFCRVLSGQRRPGVSREDGLRWVREGIWECLPAAEAHGVTLVIENHYKDGFWAYPEFAQRMDLFLELLEAVGNHPRFGVNYDPSNAILAGDDPLALLEAVKDRVVTMHASDRYFEGGTLADLRRLDADPHGGYASILRHGVVGKGLNDYDRIFGILRSVGFRGWISIEDGPDPSTGVDDIAQSAIFLRRKMAEHGLP
ncbi:MAG: sugar phosphate isomerase/epimerase [Verrucomicrobiales bacterium]|nr:sugar phosphate isomerase/epimerase [Verrucomicrobiales bacterium]